MSKFKYFEDLDIIRDYVVNATENKKWIYSIPQEEELKGRIDVIRQREIDHSKNLLNTQINNKTMDVWRNNVEWNNDINPIDKFR